MRKWKTPSFQMYSQDRNNYLPPGHYLAIVKEIGKPFQAESGKHWFSVICEEVAEQGRGRESILFIACNEEGEPTPTFPGAGRWLLFLKALGLEEKEEVTEEDLLWRGVRIKVAEFNGKCSVQELYGISPSERDVVLHYLVREYEGSPF